MLRSRLGLVATLAALVACLAAPAAASAFQLAMPQASNTRPAGFTYSGTEAIRIAARNPTVVAEAAKHGRLHALTAIQLGTTTWQVGFYSGKTEVARALVDGRTGRLIGPVYTGWKVLWPSARGVKTPSRDRIDWVTLLLCVAFVLPFADPRRPFRMLHLDLLAFVGFEVSFLLLQTGHLEASVPLQYPPLLYLLGRLAWLGLRGRERSSQEPLVPFASDRLLAVGLVALVVARLVYNVVWSTVGDVGYAGLFGADGLQHGYALYGNSTPHLDAYGPVTYFFYLPFEILFPLGPAWSRNHVQGAHLATITLDLAAIALLLLVGRRIAPGRKGRRLGLALGYAWAASPQVFYVFALNSNDALLAVFVLGALLAYSSPIARGAVLGFGAAAKFGPLGLVPIFGLGRKRSLRDLVVVGVIAVGLFVAIFLPYVHQSGLRTVWDSTIGFQMNRGSPFTLWGLHPSFEWAHVLAQLVAIALVAAGTLLPRERTLYAMAALSAAVLIALQMAGTYWAQTYIVWFVAPALIALFAGAGGVTAPGAVRTSGATRALATSGSSSSGPTRHSPG